MSLDLTDLIKGVILLAIGGIFTKFYGWLSQRPKIKIESSYANNERSGGSSSNSLLIKWRVHFEFYNPTPHDAYEIDVDWLIVPDNVEIEFPLGKHLSATQEMVTDGTCKREVLKDKRTEGIDPFEQFIPVSLKYFGILLTYRNKARKRFYTLHTNKLNRNSNAFYARKPRMAMRRLRRDLKKLHEGV